MGAAADMFSIPEPVVDTTDQKLTAQFASSTGWKQQKEYLQERINYWQHFLPDGKAVNQLSREERETAWAIADNVIREVNQWIMSVEGMKDAYAET